MARRKQRRADEGNGPGQSETSDTSTGHNQSGASRLAQEIIAACIRTGPGTPDYEADRKRLYNVLDLLEDAARRELERLGVSRDQLMLLEMRPPMELRGKARTAWQRAVDKYLRHHPELEKRALSGLALMLADVITEARCVKWHVDVTLNPVAAAQAAMRFVFAVTNSQLAIRASLAGRHPRRPRGVIYAIREMGPIGPRAAWERIRRESDQGEDYHVDEPDFQGTLYIDDDNRLVQVSQPNGRKRTLTYKTFLNYYSSIFPSRRT